MPYDTFINSTITLTNTAKVGGVQTTMDTCTLTILNPNRSTVIGPVAVAAVSNGFYTYLTPLGTLNIPGTWSQVWYVQFSTQSLQTTSTFQVGP